MQRGVRHDRTAEVRCCNDCGFKFLSPRPTEDELLPYYRNEYRIEYGDQSLTERYDADAAEAAARVERLRPYLAPEARLLELGAGSGAFLMAVRSNVADAIGVEPDAGAREWLLARDLLVHADVAEAGAAFDGIVLFHVLEHVPDPVAFLRQLGTLVRPGGFIAVEVPNVDDALLSLYQLSSYSAFYYQRAHLSYFNPRTLQRAFEKAGLTAEVSGLQRYDLSNHLRWLLTREPGGQGYYKDVLSPEGDEGYAAALVRAGLADSLWAIGRLQ